MTPALRINIHNYVSYGRGRSSGIFAHANVVAVRSATELSPGIDQALLKSADRIIHRLLAVEALVYTCCGPDSDVDMATKCKAKASCSRGRSLTSI